MTTSTRARGDWSESAYVQAVAKVKSAEALLPDTLNGTHAHVAIRDALKLLGEAIALVAQQ